MSNERAGICQPRAEFTRDSGIYYWLEKDATKRAGMSEELLRHYLDFGTSQMYAVVRALVYLTVEKDNDTDGAALAETVELLREAKSMLYAQPEKVSEMVERCCDRGRRDIELLREIALREQDAKSQL